MLYRIPFCRPYWNRRTIGTIFSRLLSGRVSKGHDIHDLESRLSRWMGVPGVVLCDSGRTAIEIGLRALGIESGSEVIIPTFCCRSVIHPLLSLGIIPIFADVDDSLSLTAQTVASSMTHRTRAVIVPHLFGNPVSITEIVELCAARGVYVIDDAAQALGATWQGQPLGTFGQVGILSFGKGKVCFGTGGGAMISLDPDTISRARSIKLAPPDKLNASKDALSIFFWRYLRKWTLPLYTCITRLRLLSEHDRPYRPAEISNIDAAVAVTLLDTLSENISRRRIRASRYSAMLAGCGNLRLVRHRDTSACLTQVIQLALPEGGGPMLSRILKILHRHGFEVGTSYKPLHLLPDFRSGDNDRLPYSSAVWNSLIELPCEPSIPITDINAISDLVFSSLSIH